MNHRGLSTGNRLTILFAAAAAALGALALTTPSTTAGFTAKITNSANTAATAPYFKCTDAAAADKSSAVFQYALNEASGSTTVTDSSGNGSNDTYQGSMTTSTTAPLACARDTGGAYVLDGSTSFITSPSNAASSTSPTAFTEEGWFKTTVAGGKIIGFGSARMGSSSTKDRHLYINASGQLVFGTLNGSTYQTLTTPSAVTDGKWHYAAATMSTSAGMTLYFDGKAVASNPTYTAATSYSGYWRIGYDNLNGWPGVPSNYYFTGSLRYVAAYTTALTAQQILNHYAAGQ